jgi:histidinol-phosphate aminotransferase
MAISRRRLLGRLGAGAAAVVAGPRLAGAPSALTSGGAPADTNRSGEPIRLNRNENPYGPSPAVLSAIRDAASAAASRYPDIEAEVLRRKIAALHRVAPEQVVLGCGSSEILRSAIGVLVGPGKKLVTAAPTFEPIGAWAQRAGAEVVGVRVGRDYTHDLDAMLARIDVETRLVYICNPNNPTGRLTGRRDLEAFLRKLPPWCVVLMDEAYHHYVGDSSESASFIDRPIDSGDQRVAQGRPFDSGDQRVAQGRPFDSGGQRVAQGRPLDGRVIVTRTFSKIHGLAGVRIGYAIAAIPIARVLTAHALGEGVSVVAARAAAAALDDTGHVRMSVRRNIDDRQEFLNQATARMLRLDSLTNFVMLDTGRPAVEAVEHFRKHGILVAGPVAEFDKDIRVSLGTPADMREFWRVWDLMTGGHKMSM